MQSVSYTHLFWFLIRTLLKQKTLDEMKNDFTNNITHELKTPIAVAYAANDALLNFNQAEEKSKRDQYLRISQEPVSYTHLNQLRVHPELAIFLTLFAGFWLGRLKIGKFSLGTCLLYTSFSKLKTEENETKNQERQVRSLQISMEKTYYC